MAEYVPRSDVLLQVELESSQVTDRLFLKQAIDRIDHDGMQCHDFAQIARSWVMAPRVKFGSLPLDDPRGSPLFRISTDLPPMLIQVGSEEILLDDARRYAAEASKAGASITLEVWQGMHHVFQLDVKTLASSRPALDRVAAFLRSGR